MSAVGFASMETTKRSQKPRRATTTQHAPRSTVLLLGCCGGVITAPRPLMPSLARQLTDATSSDVCPKKPWAYMVAPRHTNNGGLRLVSAPL
jgi:hypothetical protein